MAEIDNLIAEVNKKYKTDIIRKASDLKGIEQYALTETH